MVGQLWSFILELLNMTAGSDFRDYLTIPLTFFDKEIENLSLHDFLEADYWQTCDYILLSVAPFSSENNSALMSQSFYLLSYVVIILLK